MLKLSNPPTDGKVDKKEEDVLSLENRRSRAESEFLIICEDKKALLADIEKLEEDKKAGKEAIQKNNDEIVETNQAIAEVKATLRTEKQASDDAIKELNNIRKEIEADIVVKTNRKSAIANDISALSKKHEADKEAHAKEIKELQATKSNVKNGIKMLEDRKTDIGVAVFNGQKILDDLSIDIKNLVEQVVPLEKTITGHSNTIEDQKNTITNNKVIISQQETTKKDKEAELVILDGKIAKKEEEHKELEKKAFVMMRERELLDNREAFLKSQYERAGIKWE